MYDNDLYREVLLERLAHPVNQGFLDNPTREIRLQNPLCGDVIFLQIEVKNNIIEQAVYSGEGCAISQVSASFLAEKIQGKSLEEVEKIEENDILDMLSINPGPARLKCALLSLEALKKLTEK